MLYTVVAILDASNGEDKTEMYRIKPEVRVRTKVVNASKLKKATGPWCREKIEEERLDVTKHIDEAIERVVDGGATRERQEENEHANKETQGE